MNVRLWYPQLDVFDCVRRITAIVRSFQDPPGLERLYITDFYLANPPLLHKTNMSQATRAAFRSLKIPRPEKTFLTYPDAPLLFHRMEPIQKGAVRAMAGKGLVSIQEMKRGVISLTPWGKELLNHKLGERITEDEAKLIGFLVNDFACLVEVGTKSLRQRTGLRRMR